MRFTPKMRRRRQNKTDYQARARLVGQDKNKYNTPKYRLVVRITNKDVICQIVSSKIIGDVCHCVAYAHELPRYGLEVGLTNYAACYATGLLLARRVLKQMKLDGQYEGVEEVTGEFFMEERDEEDEEASNNPFAPNLDVGLRATTTGSRVFACMKGAVDGGLAVPHGEEGKRFVGYTQEGEQGQFDADVLRKYIFGGHVAEYMEKLQEKDEEAYKRQFSQYIKRGLTHEDLEELYTKVHAAIRANPEADTSKKAARENNKKTVSKYVSSKRKTRAERRDHVFNKILAIRAKAGL